MINPCGMNCSNCSKYVQSCNGCEELKGKPFWIKYFDNKPCPIYSCAEEKQIEHCGYCDNIPCQIWFDLKDPDRPLEEHLQSIKRRSGELLKLAQVQ